MTKGAAGVTQRLEVSILEELRSLLRDDVIDPDVEPIAVLKG